MTLQNICIRIRFHFNVFNPMAVTQCCFNIGPASKTLGQHWNSIGWMPRVCAKYTADPVMDKCWASVVDDWPTLNQQWGSTLAQHWTRIWCVGLHSLYRYVVWQVLNECWPAPAMVMEGIHVEDILKLVSLVLSLIISAILLLYP